MTKKYKIKLQKEDPKNRLGIPDKFDTPEEAYRFIDDWKLYDYKPKIVGFDDLDDFRLEEYPNTKYDLTDDGKGKKYDTGKPMAGTVLRVFPRALMAVGACIKFGTTKYPNPKNWQLVDNGYERYQDSLIRHILKHQQDILIDNETKLPHLYHALWNMLAITELYLMEHPELMEELNK